MYQLDIASMLAKPHNEFILKSCFCYTFDEYSSALENDSDENYCYRVAYNCRTGDLVEYLFGTHSNAYYQWYMAYGDEALNFIPILGKWLPESSFELFKQESDFPMQKMLDYGWTKWRIDAEEYIIRESADYPIAGPDENHPLRRATHQDDDDADGDI